MNAQLLTAEDVADQLNVSVQVVYRLVARREIGSVRIANGRALRFTPENVTDYIRTREIPAAK